MLSDEQNEVLQYALHVPPDVVPDILVTGIPGSGKSHVFFGAEHKTTYPHGFVVASARQLIAGRPESSTLFSLVGITPKLAEAVNYDAMILAQHIATKQCLFASVVRDYSILYIEEVFTVPRWIITLVLILRLMYEKIYKKQLRLIMIGDPYQCGPVGRMRDGASDLHGFFFEHPPTVSHLRKLKHFTLTKPYRQHCERTLDLLMALRAGALQHYHIAALRERFCANVDNLPPGTTILVSLKTEQTEGNTAVLEKTFIPEDHLTIRAKTTSKYNMDEHTLTLAIGASVILDSNGQDPEHYRGARGVIVAIAGYTGHAAGVPHKLFAVKKNACTVDKVKDILVRVDSGRILRIVPRMVETNNPHTNVNASYTQFPLKLGYFITIHGSQGMTLSSVAVSLEHAFEPGQVYTALSRIRSLSGLHVLSMNETNLRDPDFNVLPEIRNFTHALKTTHSQEHCCVCATLRLLFATPK